MEHQINDYIINFLTRKESPEDIRKLKEWLEADPEHREELKQWLKTWDAGKPAVDTERYRHKDAYNRFLFRLENEKPTRTIDSKKTASRTDSVFMTIRRIAAVFVIGFLSGVSVYYFFAQQQPSEVAFVESIVPLGSKSEIKLPDGSIVWLNAGSKMRYPTNYGEKVRDIYLEGEGYFKVAKQTEKPFTVHTALMNIKALGTEFNVKAYPEEGIAETTLISGEVVIDKEGTNIDDNRPVLLKPGQKLLIADSLQAQPEPDVEPQPEKIQPSVKPDLKIKQLPPTIIDAEVSWKERNWRIESEELQSLAVKLERRYDVQIRVDDMLKSYRFSGTIKDESLEQVLNAMQLTAPILFKVEGKTVEINVNPKRMK